MWLKQNLIPTDTMQNVKFCTFNKKHYMSQEFSKSKDKKNSSQLQNTNSIQNWGPQVFKINLNYLSLYSKYTLEDNPVCGIYQRNYN